MRRIISGLAVGAAALSLAACTSTGGSSAAPASAPAQASAFAAGGVGGTIDGTNWVLKAYDVSGTATPVPADVKVDAHFNAGRINGFSGCNVYNGPAVVTGSSIKIGPVAGTLMACVGPGATVEQAYLANLGKVTSFTAYNDALTLYDSDAKTLLTYAAGSANPLEGSWNVTGYNNGKTAVISPIAGTTLTADFGVDTVSGSSGCNTYSGPYTLTGTDLKVGPLASTRKACEQAIMDQEAQFLTALQTPTKVEPSGATVTLRAANGETQVILAAK